MLKLKDNIITLVNNEEENLKEEFNKIDELCYMNSKKVLDAFHEYEVSESDLGTTTGYGYNDIGRDKIEQIFSHIFKSEDALVRNQIISGSHAINIGLTGILRPNDIILSITGRPYDTIHEVIGIKDNNSSLISFGIKYHEIDLIDNDFDYNKIKEFISSNKTKMIYIQRSRGYSLRESINIYKLEKIISFIKKIDSNIIIFVDNCYCEFVEELSPIEVGASICVGSLIKNLGGGIATNGGYLVGRKDLIHLCAERLTLPGEGKEVGPSLNGNRMFLQGLYNAPHVVAASLKVAILTSKVLDTLGYKTLPLYNKNRCDIVQIIYFNDENKLIKYAQGIQYAGAIDAHVTPIASDMPGYDDKIIMSSPSFVQGSSIEISCDGPLKEPYALFQQGSITYEYGKIAIINAISNLED